MKFGKEFRSHLEETLPEWRDKFLCYKPLKKILKRFPNTNIPVNNAGAVDLDRQAVENDSANGGGGVGTGGAVAGPRGADPSQINPRNMTSVEFQEWFVRFLNEELEKFNDFYVDKEEEFVIRLQELKERIERMQERRIRDGVAVSESEFSEEMMDIRKEFVTIHGEMVLLKNYSSLNFAGLVKILKKYDKRTGGLLRLPFTQLAVHQPFSTTEPLTRLVRECEANLELLFPMEDEVIESTTSALGNQHSAPFNDITNIPSEAASLGDANFDIYRSTLSAMRTIQGLRRSSTYNPLSFATLFRNQDDEGSGAVTAENSASNSAASSDEDDLKTVEPKDSGSAP